MRVLIQRVKEASVSVENNCVGKINNGILIFLGVHQQDNSADIEWICHKIINLRIFSDEAGKMNKSIMDINGDVLIVSQFTLFASTKKGNRPSFIDSAPPAMAEKMYEDFITLIETLINKPCAKGIFGADMQVSLINDGPVTIWIDSKNKE